MQLAVRFAGCSNPHAGRAAACSPSVRQPDCHSAVKHSIYVNKCALRKRQARASCSGATAAGPDVPSSIAQTCPSSDLSFYHSSSSSSRVSSRCAATATAAPVLVAEMEQLHLQLSAIESSMNILHAAEVDHSGGSSSVTSQNDGAGPSSSSTANMAADTVGASSHSAEPARATALWTPPKPTVWLPDGRASSARLARLATGPGGEDRTSRLASRTAAQSAVAATTASSTVADPEVTVKRLTNVYMASSEVSSCIADGRDPAWFYMASRGAMLE